jgi:hypothetical protein
MKMLLITVLVVVMLGGCASMHELSDDVVQQRKSGKQGVSKIYPITASQAWEITESVFRWEKTDEVEKHGSENYVITGTGMNMAVFGSVIVVWIEPADVSNTKITVMTKRRVQDDIFTSLNEATFFKRFEQGVDIVSSGKKLPVACP